MTLSSILKTTIDWFVIIVEVTFWISITYCVLFDNLPLHPYISLIFFQFIFHLLRFGIKIRLFSLVKNSFLVQAFFAVILIDVIQNLIFYDSTLGIAILINSTLFMNYLCNMYLEKKSLESLIAPYNFYCSYNAITSLVIFLLFVIGFPYDINEVTDSYSLLKDNALHNVVYYFPHYLAIASDYHPGIGFPVVSGLSHEPNVIMYILIPSFFFMLGMVNRNFSKFVLYFVILVMLGETTSTTAILLFMLCVFIDALWNSMYFHKYQQLYVIAIFALAFIYLLYDYFEAIYNLVNMKVNNEDDSGGTSTSMLAYLLYPDGLIGTGNFPTEYGLQLKNHSAGLLVGLMDLIIFISFLYQSLRLIINKSYYFHYIGLGCFYFILHSLKGSYMTFWHPILPFMILILVISNKHLKAANG